MSVFLSSYLIYCGLTPNSPSEKERSKTPHTNRRFTGVLFSHRFDCSFVHAKRPLNHLSGLSEEILIQQIAMAYKFLLMRFPNFLGKRFRIQSSPELKPYGFADANRYNAHPIVT